MKLPKTSYEAIEKATGVQKRNISWEEFEKTTGLKRPEPPAPEPPPPDPAVTFAALLEAVRHKPRQKAFGQVIRQKLAAKGMTQAQASPLLGFKNRGQFGNLLDARNGAWNEDRLERLLAVLEADAASLLEALPPIND